MLTTSSRQRVQYRCSPPARGRACRAGAYHHVEAACAVPVLTTRSRQRVPVPMLTTRSRQRVAALVLTTRSRRCVPCQVPQRVQLLHPLWPPAGPPGRGSVCRCRAGSRQAGITAPRIHGHCIKKVRTLSTIHRIGREAAPALDLRVLSRTEYITETTEDTEYRFSRAARQRTQAERACFSW